MLHEIVLNALAHRDYALGGDRIRIYLFGTDRLEVHSPGRLAGPMRIENLLTRRYSRNSTLVQGLITLKIMEEIGFGLDRVMEALQAEGLPPPEFTDAEGTFIVTLRGHGARLLAEPPAREDAMGGPRTTPRRRRMGSRERQAWVLDHLRMVGPISTRAYAQEVGVSPDTALNDLTALAAQGLVQAQGTTRDRRWVLRPARSHAP